MKQKLFIIIITCVISLIWLPFSYAELYKYVDENGVVSYTDDYSILSEYAKESIEVVEEIKSTEKEEVPAEDDTDSQTKDITEKETKSLKIIKDELRNTEKELDKEYAALNLEKKNLAQESGKAKSKQEKIEYNEKITNLNNRIKTYSEKSKAFQQQVDEYNNRIKSKNWFGH